MSALALLLASVLAASFLVSRLGRTPLARVTAWAVVVASAVLAERTTREATVLVRMLAISTAVLWSLKGLVCVDEGVRLSPLRWLAFAAGYPGMRPSAFVTLLGPPREGARDLAVRAVSRLVLGVLLAFAARSLGSLAGSPALTAYLLLPAVSLVGHFGLFGLSSALFRALGADTDALFRAPLLASTLSDFWGKRWNRAFSELAAISVYRPLSSSLGRGPALLASFVFSGLLHELAISVPLRAGYGGPLAYFLLQGALVLLEKHGFRVGRVGTLAALALPLPLLFPPPFVLAVLRPLAA